MFSPAKFDQSADSTNGQRQVIIVQRISSNNGWSLLSTLVGIYACIIGFMNTHNACYMNTGIGKLNLPIMLLFIGFVLAIGGCLQLFGNNYNKQMENEACGYLFIIAWIIMYAVILFRDKSTCRADSPLFYWTALGIWIYALVDLCIVGNRQRIAYTVIV